LIPTELIELVRERRVIPFVGAGFSASLGLPLWRDLLAQLARETPDCLSYEELARLTNDDPLQMAEYLFLKSDARIGPLRHTIEQLMPPNLRPHLAAPHVELVNLGAAQIYTTNYDDLIETTYSSLGLPAQRVALAKDVALANSRVTQIVKFHGDLRHEETLVLTESSYHRRLDFESPMDLKFRSDLLGRSVLFMGYSFRDINIRVIWFKLMQMMKDIPQGDRLPSFMVRVDPNPALEELNRAVGLRTIVLDPEGRVQDDAEKGRLLGEFLHDLASRAARSHEVIPGTKEPLFVSAYLADALAEGLSSRVNVRGRSLRVPVPNNVLLRRLLHRRWPPELAEGREETILSALGQAMTHPQSRIPWQAAVRLVSGFPASELLTYFVARGLGQRDTRSGFYEAGWEALPWERFWGTSLSSREARGVLKSAYAELEYHRDTEPDDDLAYHIDLVARIAKGLLYSGEEESDPLRDEAISWLAEVSELYEEARYYEPQADGPPEVGYILARINEVHRQWAQEEGGEVDFDPFEVHESAEPEASDLPDIGDWEP
jgi:hypothetical protein